MARRDRGPTGRFERRADTAERDAEAARLRARGLTYGAIAVEMEYADHTGARKAVERAMTTIVAEPAAEVRERELSRLDAMYAAALKVLETPHLTVSHGRVMKDDNDEPIPDDGPVLTAIDRLLKIQARRAQLLGLDQPAKVHVTTEAESDFDRAYAELTAAMSNRTSTLSE